MAWKTNTGVCFITAYIEKKTADKVLQVSPKVGLGNNCPLLYVNDGGLQRVRRINRLNQLKEKNRFQLLVKNVTIVFLCVFLLYSPVRLKRIFLNLILVQLILKSKVF